MLAIPECFMLAICYTMFVQGFLRGLGLRVHEDDAVLEL